MDLIRDVRRRKYIAELCTTLGSLQKVDDKQIWTLEGTRQKSQTLREIWRNCKRQHYVLHLWSYIWGQVLKSLSRCEGKHLIVINESCAWLRSVRKLGVVLSPAWATAAQKSLHLWSFPGILLLQPPPQNSSFPKIQGDFWIYENNEPLNWILSRPEPL